MVERAMYFGPMLSLSFLIYRSNQFVRNISNHCSSQKFLEKHQFLFTQTDQPLALFDAGLDNTECWNALDNTLSKDGFKIHNITHIFLTHHHIDHVELINRIASVNPVPVFTHTPSFPRLKRDPEFIQMRINFFEKLYREMGCGEAGVKQVEYLNRTAKANQSRKIEGELIKITGGTFEDLEIVKFLGTLRTKLHCMIGTNNSFF